MSLSYDEQLQHEAEVWGTEAERMAHSVPPDWAHHRHLRHNQPLHVPHIEALPMLRGVRGLERFLMRIGRIVPSGQVVYARK